MSKLSKREKVLLVVFIIVIIALAWFKLFYQPMSEKIAEYNDMQATEETQYLSRLPLVQKKKTMQEELEKLQAEGTAKKIPVYDNSKPLMEALNKVMVYATDYSLDFGQPDHDDYIVLHTINLSYSAESYYWARTILDKINEYTYPNQIADVNMSIDGTNGASVNSTITFFELAE